MNSSSMALLSYGFHELTKHAVQGLLKHRAKKSRGSPEASSWKTLSTTLAKPGSLPIVSVVGPRWNCHAQIASIGPLQIQRSVTIHTSEIGANVDSWSIVLYDEGSRTVAWAGSSNTAGPSVTWSVGPGHYNLIMRVYTDASAISVPNVEVDSRDLRCGRTIEGEAQVYQQYLQSIRNRGGLYYSLLHYYAFHHLKHADKPESWLRRHFIPVGNPDTEWLYGHVDPKQRLFVVRDEDREEGTQAFISFYNWSSFPVYWARIEGARWFSPTFDQPVAYAIRRVRTTRASDAVLGRLEAKVVPASDPLPSETAAQRVANAFKVSAEPAIGR